MYVVVDVPLRISTVVLYISLYSRYANSGYLIGTLDRLSLSSSVSAISLSSHLLKSALSTVDRYLLSISV